MADKNYAYIAEKLYEELEKSCTHYGADITISVTRNGIKTEYPLYDHAALVQGLMSAIDYFISEL